MQFSKVKLFFLYLSAVLTFIEATQKLPSFLKLCNRSDPNLNNCVTKSIEDLKPRFANGIPELYMPPLEPLTVPEVKIDQTSGPVFVHSLYENIKIYGLSKFNIEEVRADTKDNRFMLKILFPSLNISSDYEISGKIMLMPLQGDGTLRGNFSDVTVTSFLKGETFTRQVSPFEEKQFLKIKDIIVSFTLGGASIALDNLFNGEPTLGATMNSFLNDNWKIVASEIRPVMQDAMAEMLKEMTVKFFDAFSYDQLLPA